MPTSDSAQITPVMNMVRALNPKKVLDVGVGFGKYGVLIREYLEVAKYRYSKKDWKIRLDGIEIFKPYIKNYHKYFYDRIMTGDIRKMKIEKYDLILALDILEHFNEKDMRKVLKKLRKHAKYLIVSTPKGYTMQGAWFGNENEKHIIGINKTFWNPEEADIYDCGDGYVVLL